MKLSIKSRLYIGFAVAIILVISIGITSFRSVERQVIEAGWVKHAYQVTNQLETVSKLMLDMETGRRGFRPTNEQMFLEPYNNALSKIKPAVAELKDLISDNPSQITRANELENTIDTLLLFWKNLGTTNVYSKQEIINTTSKEKVYMDHVRLITDEMKYTETELLNVREIEKNKAIDSSRRSLMIGISLILIIVLVLIYFILSEFKSRNLAEKLLQTNLLELEKLNEETNLKNWLLKGVTEVNDAMQGINEVDQLCNSILSTLVGYFKIPAGALYIYDEREKVLVLTASHALSNSVKQKVKLHEGLLGEAAAIQTQTVVKVPPDYINIQSSVIQAPVARVTFLPFYLNNKLKGILELLSYRDTEYKIDLSNIISNNIAIAIDSAQDRKKVINLLEQVQQQKEVLISQQEELRQTNEELSKQTEELQASEEELRTQEEELRQINSELEEKNEAVEFAKQNLAKQATELEITSKYKSEFLANMSHELRTPLNSVLILAKMLAENKSDNLNPKQIEYANIIHKSGGDLLELINDILDLSKIEAGKVDLNIESVQLESISENMLQLFSVLASEKNITFKTAIQDNTIRVIKTDQQRIEQVIKNLLSNAFKFTKAKGSITLSFSPRTKFDVPMLAISVTDTGIGIPETKQQLIFEAFQQADGSTSRKFGGTGLGLSISKELMRLLGGEIELYSVEGKGSTFTLLLPYTFSYKTDKEAAPATIQVRKEHLLTVATEAQEQTIIQDDRSDIAVGEKTMLIIEDDNKFASILRDYAREKGYKTIIALQGDEGLHYARKYKPNAIILDIQLPVIDGWSILNILKNDPDLKHIPVHIISAFDDDKLNHAGAFAYLKKPVSGNDLEKAFSSIGIELESQFKKILVFSKSHFSTDDQLQKLFSKKHADADFKNVQSIAEAQNELSTGKYDCVIADIGNNVDKGVEELMLINKDLQSKAIPVIIYLDTDISTTDELQLKKISDVIVRRSSLANNRLMDELELFLYKVQQVNRNPILKQIYSGTQDGSLKNKKVLLVDDDMRNVFALSAVLEEQDMNVITAGDGKEALEQLKRNPDTDIILMDIMMPEMDGYEAMQHIRKELKFFKLPIIALTAKAMTGDREKCIEAGASDYITKPIEMPKLFSLMRVWLSS